MFVEPSWHEPWPGATSWRAATGALPQAPPERQDRQSSSPFPALPCSPFPMPAISFLSAALRRPILNGLIAACLICAFATRPHAAEYVIHISVDGLNSAVLQTLIDAGKAPNFKRFEDEGAWTLNARADYFF